MKEMPLDGFPVVITLPVQWGDQDAFGHVNNTVYLRWTESARVEYLTRAGIWQRMDTERIGPILAAVSCSFLRALTYPDEVSVGARVERVGNSSFKMVHRIVSRNQAALAAEVETTLVLYDYNAGKPVPLPAEARRAIEEIERPRP